MADHTYDKWQELGYQVKRGERAAYVHYGQNIFTFDQVFRADDHNGDCTCTCDESYEDSYENHCWNCKEDISSDSEEYCGECEMFVCSNCGECMCGYN